MVRNVVLFVALYCSMHVLISRFIKVSWLNVLTMGGPWIPWGSAQRAALHVKFAVFFSMTIANATVAGPFLRSHYGL